MTDDDDTLDVPRLRVWELGENSTRFDNLVAAPSDEERVVMWILWSFVAGAVFLVVLIVFAGILLNQRARRSAFNTYLLYLMFPDAVFSGFCFLNCVLNVAAGKYVSELWCRFQSFYVIFGIGANAWLNALVTREIFKMLRYSSQRLRYFPPTRRRVTGEALCCYAWAMFVAAWGVLPDSWGIPHRSYMQSGEACLPIQFSNESTIFFYVVFIPAFALIPLLYVGYVSIVIYRKGLLPKQGKARNLAVYFGRIIAVFALMWLPSLLLLFILGSWLNPWAMWSAGAWSHLQGAVSAAVSLLKPDIRHATKRLLTCQCRAEDDTDFDAAPSGEIRVRRRATVRESESDTTLRETLQRVRLEGEDDSLRVPTSIAVVEEENSEDLTVDVDVEQPSSESPDDKAKLDHKEQM